jgi:hypothetical protein
MFGTFAKAKEPMHFDGIAPKFKPTRKSPAIETNRGEKPLVTATAVSQSGEQFDTSFDTNPGQRRETLGNVRSDNLAYFC